MTKLNLGCGADYLVDYVNIDKNCKADINRDLLDQLPFDPESVDEVLASHLLEHFGFAEVPIFISRVNKVLKKGGLFHIRVPDIEKSMRNFLENKDDKKWSWWILEIYGGQWNPGEFHKSGYTKERLIYLMKELGFKVGEDLPPRIKDNLNITEINIKFIKE